MLGAISRNIIYWAFQGVSPNSCWNDASSQPNLAVLISIVFLLIFPSPQPPPTCLVLLPSKFESIPAVWQNVLIISLGKRSL